MIIPEKLRKSVAFVCYRDTKNKDAFAGTCFFFALEYESSVGKVVFRYTVTAKHVIVGIRKKSIDSRVILRVNLKSGGYEYIETDIDDWFSNPDDPSDVSVLSWSPVVDSKYDVVDVLLDMVPLRDIEYFQRPGVGDDVAVIGLFVNHVGKKKNIPIVRAGNIAALPEERVATSHFGDIDAYLIECRSIGGLSGSPVYAHLTGPRINEDGTANYVQMRFIWLLGIIHGHYDIPDPEEDMTVDDLPKREIINMGIAIVVPAEKIMDVLNHPKMVDEREREIKNAQKIYLPTED